MVNAGRKRRTSVFCRFFGHQDLLNYFGRRGLPSAQSVSISRPNTFAKIVGLKEAANFTVFAARAVMLLFLAGVMSITAPAVGATVGGVPDLARPGEECKVLPLSEWTQSEKWAWTEICEARTANFNLHLRADLLDPRDGEDEENLFDRILRSRFLETILLHEPFRSAIPRQGVHIIGAYFPNRIDLSDASIDRPLRLEQSRFELNVKLLRLTTSTFISFQGSILKGRLYMDSATVGGDLLLSEKAEFNAVDLEGANIGGRIAMVGSKFKGNLDMDSATVGGELLLSDKAEFKAVYLAEAKIDGQIDMTDSKFKGKLSMYGATVGGDLVMSGGAYFDTVDLVGANIGGVIDMIGSKFKGELSMDSATVGGDLFMSGGAYFDTVDLVDAKIGGRISMSGSKFKGKLSMNSATVGGDLFMRGGAHFDAVDLVSANIGGGIDMRRSTFEGKLNMNSATVGSHLSMSEKAEFNAVDLVSANIGGQIAMVGSTFEGELNMETVTVGRDLYMIANSKFDAVNLEGANIGGRIAMGGSTFEGKLSMYGATVGGDLFMKEGAEFNAVDLSGAKIGGLIEISGSKFKGEFSMDSATVRGGLFMREGAEFDAVFLVGANIGGVLIMTGATFEGKVIMDYAMIGSHLMIHGATFENSAILSLRHTNVGTLQDDEKVWPEILNLDGFTYERLVGMYGSDEAANRGSGWFVKWLEKNEIYSPQPYRHLASVLRAAGHNDMANEILVASRDREREESSMLEIKWWVLTLLKYFIGYGYGNWNFLALLWAAALVLVGTFVLVWTKEREINNEFHNRLDPFFYSLDMLLPIIRLREHHYKNVDLKTRARYYFYFHQVMGYVLIFFVIAGLSGLTS